MNSVESRTPLAQTSRLEVIIPRTNEQPQRRSLALAPGWKTAAMVIGFAALVFGFVFHADLQAAIRVWIDSTASNHCFLVLPLIGFLLWERRAVFHAMSPTAQFWPLLTIPLLSAAWLGCAVLDLKEGRQLSLMAMFDVVVLATIGMRAARHLLAPLLFLFFLVPSGAFLVPALQSITADITVHGLQLLHIPVYSDGLMIEIPEGRFEIAEACAGLRFLIASIVFGCFFAVTMYRSYWRRLLFIALSLSVPIGANGLRALGIITLAHLEGSAAAVETDHILYGWIFFSLVILLLIAIGMSFTEAKVHRLPAFAPAGKAHSSWRTAAAAGAGVVLALLGPAYAAQLDEQFSTASLPTMDVSEIGAPWHAFADGGVGWRPLVHDVDREMLRSFEAPDSAAVIGYIALYRLRPIGNMLTYSENRLTDDKDWRLASASPAIVSIAGRPVTVNTAQILSGDRRRVVWSFYVVDGRIVAGQLDAKLLQAKSVLLRHAPVAAFVAVSASADESNARANNDLKRFFDAWHPVIERLEAFSK